MKAQHVAVLLLIGFMTTACKAERKIQHPQKCLARFEVSSVVSEMELAIFLATKLERKLTIHSSGNSSDVYWMPTPLVMFKPWGASSDKRPLSVVTFHSNVDKDYPAVYQAVVDAGAKLGFQDCAKYPDMFVPVITSGL